MPERSPGLSEINEVKLPGVGVRYEFETITGPILVRLADPLGRMLLERAPAAESQTVRR